MQKSPYLYILLPTELQNVHFRYWWFFHFFCLITITAVVIIKTGADTTCDFKSRRKRNWLRADECVRIFIAIYVSCLNVQFIFHSLLQRFNWVSSFVIVLQQLHDGERWDITRCPGETVCWQN